MSANGWKAGARADRLPSMVMVYSYAVFDCGRGGSVVLPGKRSRESIARVRGARILEESGEDVPASALDETGLYRGEGPGVRE